MKLLLCLLAASLLELSGCSDNPVNQAATAGDPADVAGFDQESPLTVLAYDPDYGVPAGVQTYEVTIENLTPATVEGGSQVFSPPILAMHGPWMHIVRVGSFASHELELIAEDGDTGPMKSLLEGSRGVSAVVTGDGPIPPSAVTTYELEASDPFRRLSMAFMLVNTNDGFSGLDRLRLPDGGKVSYNLNAWDAGTEQITELAADIPGPCCGNPNHGPDEHLRIRAHAGILGIGDLDVADYGWPEPSARLTIVRIT